MRPHSEIKANPRVSILDLGADGFAATVNRFGTMLNVIVSWGGGWEHASVTLRDNQSKTPSWEDMDYVARLVWADGEIPMQLHVCGPNKVNDHNGCLHLWHRHGQPAELPPKAFV